MSVSEQDLETLEVWLDGELPDEQIESFRQRLSAEPQLADAAARLRGDRELRSRLWQAMEPADSEIETLVSQVRRNVRKEELVTSRLRAFSRIASVAASIMLVFAAGWISRSRLRVGDTIGPVTPAAVAAGQPVSGNPVGGLQIQPASTGTPRLVLTQRNPNFGGAVPEFVAIPQRIDPSRISRLAPNYEVQVIDPFTHEVKFQREVERLDDAMQFANYIARFQGGPESIPQQVPSAPQMNIVPVNELQRPQP